LGVKENHHESLTGKAGVAVKEFLTITHGPEERTKGLPVKEISYKRVSAAYHATVKESIQPSSKGCHDAVTEKEQRRTTV